MVAGIAVVVVVVFPPSNWVPPTIVVAPNPPLRMVLDPPSMVVAGAKPPTILDPPTNPVVAGKQPPTMVVAPVTIPPVRTWLLLPRLVMIGCWVDMDSLQKVWVPWIVVYWGSQTSWTILCLTYCWTWMISGSCS